MNGYKDSLFLLAVLIFLTKMHHIVIEYRKRVVKLYMQRWIHTFIRLLGQFDNTNICLISYPTDRTY